MTASLGFIITYAWVLSSDETGALVWLSDWACVCRNWLLPPMVALPHACLPVRWWIRFAAGTTIKYFRGCRPTGKPRRLKRATGTFLRATFRIHNHLPPKQKKDIPFGMSFCFGGRWWIRTTEVIDDRFTVCSLWPLGKPSIFNYQLDWSWWTGLNPRPADYKSAALPTELHQHFIKSSCLSDLFSIPHAGVFVNRFIRNYCILFFRSIESDTCCRTVSSALDKSG